jgi:hypothetical protein
MVRTILAIFFVTLLWAFNSATSAQPKQPVLPKEGWPKSVTARGETEDKAREVALRDAVELVKKLMRLQDPPLKSFVLTEDYVSANLIATEQRGKDIVIEGFDNAFKEWTLTFRSDHGEWWKELVKKDREAERILRAQDRALQAEERQALGARVLFGLSCLLLVGVAYVRVDRVTRHRHTPWLRLASVGAAGIAVAGWWWLSAG